MKSIKFLAPAADWKKGQVADVDDETAARLIRTGYAQAVDKKTKE